MRVLLQSAGLLVLLLATSPARAALPSAEVLLKDFGYSDDDVAKVKAGKVVRGDSKGVHDRDLTARFAFLVKGSPAELAKRLKGGLLLAVDANTLATAPLSGDGSLDALAKLTLTPDTESRVKKYGTIKAGTDLNLSTAELADFSKLGASATAPAVESQIHSALLARYQAYRAKGLAGIAAYDRGGGKVRSPGEDLTLVMKASSALQKYAPAAYAAMLSYPGAQVAGSEDVFRWVHFKGHGVPTIALVHGLSVPEGDALLFMQRQFYVSEGFNCEQAIGALMPVEGGTVVLYVNHTSTDQVEGFGGGAKRSIGSNMMASQLEGLFTKMQQKAK